MIGDIIRRMAAGNGEGAELLFGTVTGTEPLQVTVDARFTLPEEALLIPEGMEELRIKVRHPREDGTATEEIVLQRGLQAGDAVILLAAGGQYLILDRVGTPGRKRLEEGENHGG